MGRGGREMKQHYHVFRRGKLPQGSFPFVLLKAAAMIYRAVPQPPLSCGTHRLSRKEVALKLLVKMLDMDYSILYNNYS